jgi:hypothetical protein
MAAARFAGLMRAHHIPGVPLRSTSGSILQPAPQAEDANIHLAQKFG